AAAADGGVGQNERNGAGRVQPGVDGRELVRVEADHGEQAVHRDTSPRSRSTASLSAATAAGSVPSKCLRTCPALSTTVSLFECSTRLPAGALAPLCSTPSRSRPWTNAV